MLIETIEVTLVQSSLHSITEQMAHALLHSARSLNLSEARDFCTGLYGSRGEIIEQTEFIPLLAYTVPTSIKNIVDFFEEDIRPGDIFIHNDPFTGGNQATDVKIAKPIFHEGRLVAWAAINAHQADVGGCIPGGYNPCATEIWQEALRIPPVKLFDGGVKRKDVWRLIFSNIRYSIVEDDILAMIGGCTIGERELVKQIEKWGYERFSQNLQKLYDQTEKMVREEFLRINNGVYYGESMAYDDGIKGEKAMPIKVKITVQDDQMTFDFTGTAEQTAGYVNAPYPVTLSGVLLTLLMCLEYADIPRNEGMLRPVRVIVPEGCLLNPRFPAATGFGNHLVDQIGEAVMQALFPALPQRVTAGWNHMLCVLLSGHDSRKNSPFAHMLINACKGGGGASFGADGYNHIGFIGGGGGIAAQDPEMFELEAPVHFHKFEYAPDSCGSGQWRGGLGVETQVEFLEDVQCSIFGEGLVPQSCAPGILGGHPGRSNTAKIIYPNGEVYYPKAKEFIPLLPNGTRWHQIAGGGGGYGSPLEREKSRVREDILEGYITLDKAKKDYGWE
ncbi:N-methylhydantoinase B/acetone carboxylase, alpha subunit [Desulfitobacterium dehalogenans ATCC 51507]|uniref:N-methylhydantoinase B/acetone carboxylase, alpha subunit n=1 Tax=Desulfitobacterium dehalogenans (strain ATCC 51507 / DSM 9161 / JW/IU-DC1) TaxID=756499 RepID=I4A8K1_DESDJ|nr:hydantoinase B/oxoprolinase family protein [Desulfitobacterium dehalogenans]AFM00286.1 N-methylhydantoinase B/acetone carboxylase, alpha subunit [Desulfitobacterium dehalogenans ATCC 51507]